MIGWIVCFPMAGACLAALLGRRDSRAAERCDAAVCVAELVLAVALMVSVIGEAAYGVTGAGASGEIGSTAQGAGITWQIEGVFGTGLHFQADGFRAVYALISALMWAATSLFSLEYFAEEREHLTRYVFFVLLTLGATEGVMLSADLMTAFVFFEILSFTSFTWVIHEQTAEAVRAGYTYLFVAVIGGLVLLMGLLLLKHSAGTLAFDELRAAVDMARAAAGNGGGAAADAAIAGTSGFYGGTGNLREIFAAGVCILMGFGAKAGMFPLHIWLPKAHPVAPSPGSALLSGILTKVGVFGILMISLTAMTGNRGFGVLVLLCGVITMVLGAVLALISVNLKRTLACSSMSQIGFILTGAAMYLLLTSCGSSEAAVTALPGLVLHMVNHSLIKLALFMIAGVVVMNLHALDLDQIRGYGRKRTLLKISFALGALGISGVPLFNGYLSKTLLHEGIVEAIHACAGLAGPLRAVEWIFLISGGITFCYMLKLFICIFVERNADEALQARYDAAGRGMNAQSAAVIFGSSLFMVILGQPAVTLRLARVMTGEAEILHFQAFSWTNLQGGLISLTIGAVLYLLVVRQVLMRDGRYLDLWPKRFDLEELVYRPVLTRVLPAVFGAVASVFGENKILTPLAKAALSAATFIGRVLSTSTDALIVLLHRTVFRPRRARHLSEENPGAWRTFREEFSLAARPLTQNLSFALLMTCIGILLVLGTLIVLLVIR